MRHNEGWRRSLSVRRCWQPPKGGLPLVRDLRVADMQTHTLEGGGGLKLHVREWGSTRAPAMLFLHGWTQHHLCWSRQIESALADEFRLVAMDLRGHGQSEAPASRQSYTDGALWADDVQGVIDALA